MKRLSVYLLAIFLAGATTAMAQLKPTALTGTWSVTERKTTGPNAQTNSKPQPGLYIFTGNHYSIMTVNSDKPRPALPQDQAKATAAELRAVWDPFTANSGTYEIAGDTVTFHPAVAKNPNVMAPGNSNVSKFKITGKTLTLTQVKDRTGPIANPTTTTLTRVE